MRINSQRNLSAVSTQSQRSLRRVSVESPFAEDSSCFVTLQRLHLDSTETPLRLYGDCAETALRIIRGGVAFKVAKVWKQHNVQPFLVLMIKLEFECQDCPIFGGLGEVNNKIHHNHTSSLFFCFNPVTKFSIFQNDRSLTLPIGKEKFWKEVKNASF